MANYHQRFSFDKLIKTADASLLAQYFSNHKITIPSGVNVNDPDEARKLISGCTEDRQKRIIEELQRIYDLAIRQMDRVMEVIKEHKIKYVEGEKPATSVMRVFFCDDPDAFDKLYDLYLYDTHSRMYFYQFDGEQFKFSEKSFNGNLEKFQSEVETYFEGCGKGKGCIIRNGQDNDSGKYFVIILRPDVMKTDYEFLEKKTKSDKSSMRPLTYRQAKQEVIDFDPATGVIGVTSNIRKIDDKKKYVKSFGITILGLKDVPDITFKKALVDSEPLKDPAFYAPTKEIEKITVTNAVLLRRGKIITTMRIKSSDVIASFDQMKIKPQYYVILSMAMKFKLHGIEKEISVEITPPEVGCIKHSVGEEIIKKYLKAKKVMLV